MEQTGGSTEWACAHRTDMQDVCCHLLTPPCGPPLPSTTVASFEIEREREHCPRLAVGVLHDVSVLAEQPRERGRGPPRARDLRLLLLRLKRELRARRLRHDLLRHALATRRESMRQSTKRAYGLLVCELPARQRQCRSSARAQRRISTCRRGLSPARPAEATPRGCAAGTLTAQYACAA